MEPTTRRIARCPTIARCPWIARYPWIALGALVASVSLLGCGTSEEPATIDLHADEAAPRTDVSDADAMALPLAELRALEERATEAAGADEAGVAAARRAASYARILALRADLGVSGRGEESSGSDTLSASPATRDEALSRAESLLREASRRRAVPGACDAALDLSRLLARDADRPDDAWLVAYRAARRFSEPSDEACATELRRVIALLDGHRADTALIAAIDADPDADDPSAALGASSASSASAWAAARADDAARAQLVSVSVLGGGDRGDRSARFVATFDHIARFEQRLEEGVGEAPTRFVIEAHAAIGAEVAAQTRVGRGGIRTIEATAQEAIARIVLTLEPGASARLWLLPDPFRLMVDVGAASTPRPERPSTVIVLDPGHGGADYGTRIFGLEESDIALDLALRTREALRRRIRGAQIVLTRDRDVFVSLEQRSAMANAIEADMFVSIHLNASDEPVERGGVTTFVLDTSGDRQALLLAARENGTRPSDVGQLSLLIASLQREEQLTASRALAEAVHARTLAGGRTVFPRLHDRHVRSAAFYVLVGATMPAILLEASFLTREDEARMLATEAYRQALAEGIAEGIAQFAAGE